MTSIRVEENASVVTWTIARPDRLNSLDADVLSELERHASSLARREDIRALVITGEGRAFVAGADIPAMQSMGEAEAREFSALGNRAFDAIESLPFPVFAAVNGFALGGGCELALACDVIYAAESAKFGLPEVKLGVIPGFGGISRLLRRVGEGRAKDLVFSGRVIDAAAALRIGLVCAVAPDGELLATVRREAESSSRMGPFAVATAKRVFAAHQSAHAEATREAVDAFARCFSTQDQKEGMAAFLEKRAAKFTGR